MASIEKTARTVDEALELGLKDLGLTAQQVRLEILEEPTKGLFGLIGTRQARVRITPIEVPAAPVAPAVPVTPAAPITPAAPAPISEAPAQAAAKEKSRASTRACEFLGGLLERMELGVKPTLNLTEDDESINIVIEGPDPAFLIGHRGETLDAIQYLTSLYVNRGQENYVRVHLDIGGYRARREDTLIQLGSRMAEKALSTGRRVALDPMNPYERRILHSSLQEKPGISTHSEGEEPMRRVVIVPEGAKPQRPR